MKRPLIPIIITLSMILSLAGALRPVQAYSTIPLLDQDQDGISNAMENAGWYTLTGGPYKTNPNDADTDHDGLTDAEEKLFNTDPTDPKSPGLSFKYQSSYKTFEYFSAKDPAYLAMVQGGNQYLLTEALVVRRGTTFTISGVNSATATLTVSGPGMTALTPVRDPARGGWIVTLPPDGTVGTYTATLTDGGWFISKPIYVIFELPTDLTPSEINASLYDDDPANQRDEVAVWWRAQAWSYYDNYIDPLTVPGPPPCPDPLHPTWVCSNWKYHLMKGYAQAFWTEQFKKRVLVDQTIKAINGMNSAFTAAAAIGEWSDGIFRINFADMQNNWTDSLTTWNEPGGLTMSGGGCESSAGVFTAMLRSAGIASKPFAMDYNKTEGHGEGANLDQFEYDHAVMMWVNHAWYAERNFSGGENQYQYIPSQPGVNQWASGTTGMHLLANVGKPTDNFRKFQDYYSDLIQTANDTWDFQVGSNGGGMVNTVWLGAGIHVPDSEFVDINSDLYWDSQVPLSIIQSPRLDILNCYLWKGDDWAPGEWRNPILSDPPGRNALQTYTLPPGIPSAQAPLENWPYNPVPTGCSQSTTSAACDAFKLKYAQNTCVMPGYSPGVMLAPQQSGSQGQVTARPATPALNTSIQLGSIISDSAIDRNGDGRFDQLNVQFELTSTQTGEYQLGGWLRVGKQQIRAEIGRVSLAAGLQTLQVSFDGQWIGDKKVNGPYQVGALWVAPVDQAVSELALPEEMVAYKTYTYLSHAYQANSFTVRAATIAGTYSHTAADIKKNGVIDSLLISVPLNIAIPGTFKVEGDLFDGQGSFVDHAVWTGSEPAAALKFKITDTQPPYSLEHLSLTGAGGKDLDSRYAPEYKITDLAGKAGPANITLGYSAPGLSPQTITPTNSFTVTPVDSNANGRYEQLVISATVNVTGQGGSYWMEGLLVDDRSMPVAWSVGDPQTLNVGPNQTLQIKFEGRMIFDQLPLASGQKFTLMAVRIFSGSPGQATLEAEIPMPGFATPVYTRSQFEPSSPFIIFQDDMESNQANWFMPPGPTQWSRTNTIWHSWTYGWSANGSGNNGLLIVASPLNLSAYARPWLRFNTAYQLSGTQSVTLDVSTNNSTWTTLKTYTGSTAYWSNEMVDLGSYAKLPAVWFRFNTHSTTTGMVWYVDDVYVIAGLDRQVYIPVLTKH